MCPSSAIGCVHRAPWDVSIQRVFTPWDVSIERRRMCPSSEFLRHGMCPFSVIGCVHPQYVSIQCRGSSPFGALGRLHGGSWVIPILRAFRPWDISIQRVFQPWDISIQSHGSSPFGVIGRLHSENSSCAMRRVGRTDSVPRDFGGLGRGAARRGARRGRARAPQTPCGAPRVRWPTASIHRCASEPRCAPRSAAVRGARVQEAPAR